jgi:hypothetical protein
MIKFCVTENVWQEICQLRGDGGNNDPVFRSRKRNFDGSYHLTRKTEKYLHAKPTDSSALYLD